METPHWHKQTDKPLYPELLWSRPENKLLAGKLLIVGGNGQGFAAPAEAYGESLKAGVGVARVVLPASLQKTVGKLFPEAIFAPSNPSGGFAQNALAELLDASMWAHGVLLAGDIGRNSETTVLLENFLEKFSGQATITKDIADHFCTNPHTILQRPNTLLVLSQGQLQKLGMNTRFGRAFTSEMGLVKLVETLQEYTKRFAPIIMTKQDGYMVVAMNGEVSTTKITKEKPVWRLQTAVHASVWWLQNPAKPFEALTSSLV